MIAQLLQLLDWRRIRNKPAYASVLHNLTATAAPTTGDDSGDGYAVGSRWVDVTADKEYVCLDASVGAAVWTETTGGSMDVGCKAIRTTDQTISTGTITQASWDSEDYDTHAFHDNSTNPTRMTIPTGQGGKYLCIFFAQWGSNNTGIRQVGFKVDGALTFDVIYPNNGAGEDHNIVSALMELSAGQYIEAWCYQASGGNLALQDNSSFFAIQRVG